MAKKSGPKPYEPTDKDRKIVEQGAAVGMTGEQVAKILGIGETTLWKYYAEQMSRGGLMANMNVAGALYNSAMRGNVTAQIFWCKTRLRWKETEHVEHSGTINNTAPVLNFILPDDKKK